MPQNVDICESTGNIEKEVELLLVERPGRRKNRPERLETAEKALNPDPECSECPVLISTHDDRRDVVLGPVVAEVGQESGPAERC